MFTKDELQTICWMCQSQAVKIIKRKIENYAKSEDKTPIAETLENDATYQRILSISRKAYAELTSE